jgi:hypothetical protein
MFIAVNIWTARGRDQSRQLGAVWRPGMVPGACAGDCVDDSQRKLVERCPGSLDQGGDGAPTIVRN